MHLVLGSDKSSRLFGRGKGATVSLIRKKHLRSLKLWIELRQRKYHLVPVAYNPEASLTYTPTEFDEFFAIFAKRSRFPTIKDGY